MEKVCSEQAAPASSPQSAKKGTDGGTELRGDGLEASLFQPPKPQFQNSIEFMLFVAAAATIAPLSLSPSVGSCEKERKIDRYWRWLRWRCGGGTCLAGRTSSSSCSSLRLGDFVVIVA